MPEPYYEDDLVALYLGDCRDITEWTDADVLVTDPPYGISWVSGKIAGSRARRTVAANNRREGALSVTNDDSTVARDAVLELWGNRPALVFGSWRSPRPDRIVNRLIWYKEKTFPGVRPAPWFAADEEIYVLGSGFVGPPAQNVYVTRRMQGASHGLAAEIGHPTPKPVGLMESLIDKCPPGVIGDPFAGSGSTLIAARNLGRRAVGIEIEERYCEIAATRLAQQTLDFSAMMSQPAAGEISDD